MLCQRYRKFSMSNSLKSRLTFEALTITGVATGTERQMEELLKQAAAGKITPEIEVLDLDEISRIFEKLKSDQITGRIVVKIP